MNQVSPTATADTPRTVHAAALVIETGPHGRVVAFEQDHSLAPDDGSGDVSYVLIEMPDAEINGTDKVRVDSALGDNLDAVRAAVEALRIVEAELSLIDRRNRGVA